MRNRNVYTALLAVCLLWACSKSDNAPSAPTQIAYEQQLAAKFYTAGNSEVPNINWNGNVGSFGLKNTTEGVSIDDKSGVISWNKLLSAGSHIIEVIAFNNAGKTTEFVKLENMLTGKFVGPLFLSVMQVGTMNFQLEFNFNVDGTLIGQTQHKNSEGKIVGPFPFFGNWVVEGNEVQGTFQYEEVDDPIPFGGIIKQNEQKVVLLGRYFPERDCLCPTFELELIVAQ